MITCTPGYAGHGELYNLYSVLFTCVINTVEVKTTRHFLYQVCNLYVPWVYLRSAGVSVLFCPSHNFINGCHDNLNDRFTMLLHMTLLLLSLSHKKYRYSRFQTGFFAGG